MSWIIDENRLVAKHPDFLSSIFTVGNGRHCTRGTLGEERHEAFRGVYQSGVYTRAPMGLMYYLAAPDWLPAFLRIDGQQPRVISTNRVLDLRTGILTRRALLEHDGTRLRLVEERFTSLDRPHLGCQKVAVRVEEGDGPVEFIFGVDADIWQSRAKYFTADSWPSCSRHGIKLADPEIVEAGSARLKAVLCSRQTAHRTAVVAAISQSSGPAVLPAYQVVDGMAQAVWALPAGSRDMEFVFEKLAIINSDLSKGAAASAETDSLAGAVAPQTTDLCKEMYLRSWAEFWRCADVEIEGDDRAQLAVRFALWATRIAAPDDQGASSMGAKNLTGDWYRGAVFWDMDVFQLPLLAAAAPHLARNHVLYRALRLDPPRRLARQNGYLGARYPGNQYDTGEEDPPAFQGMPLMELHVTFDVGAAILHYYRLSGDVRFMLDHGLEVIAETANFWSSRFTKQDDGRYHFDRACGPDQLHKPISDNAYTNRSVAEYLRSAGMILDEFLAQPAHRSAVSLLLQRCGIDEAARQRWRDVMQSMHVPMVNALVFEQFKGHSRLPVSDPRRVAVDGEGKDGITKQADTVLLFETIPWCFSKEQGTANYRYHAPHCTHTSSLSLCTHALVAARLGFARDARKYFQYAAGVDLEDSMANTRHGHHGAGQGGIWKAVVQGCGGLLVSPDGVDIRPNLPPWLTRLTYRFFKEGIPVKVDVVPDAVVVVNLGTQPVTVKVLGEVALLRPAESVTLACMPQWQKQAIDACVFSLSSLVELSSAAGSPDEGHLLPGVRRLLEDLRRGGVRCGVVVSFACDEAVLHKAGLGGLIDAFVDVNALTRQLPAGQAFLVCTQRLGALPWNSAAVCADASSLASARLAGIPTFGVGPDAIGADAHVESLSGISAEALKRVVIDTPDSLNPYREGNEEVMREEAKQ